MKKRNVILLVIAMIFMINTCQAVTYTLPEKMSNQLAIGSGLIGSFTIQTEGERFRTGFLDAVRNAEFSIRGISSGNDIHYSVFQTKKDNESEKETEKAVSELYRKDGIYYFRSDLVQDKILAFPAVSQILDAAFPAKGENGSSSSFISKIISLPEDEKKEKWDPVLSRYQNELEIWLADYTVKADTVKLDSGFSALDFTYEIPEEKIAEKIIVLAGEVTKDPETVKLLDSVMSEEEKNIYLNQNLLYFYEEALKSINIEQPIRMKKRVSAMGDVLSFSIELPMDENITGMKSLYIEKREQNTIYTVNGKEKNIILVTPEFESLQQPEYRQSLWFSCINTDTEKENNSFAIRADITKSIQTYDTAVKNEKGEDETTNHEVHHYKIEIVQDLTYVTEDLISFVPSFDSLHIDIDLHYDSQPPQNKATGLNIDATIWSLKTDESENEAEMKSADAEGNQAQIQDDKIISEGTIPADASYVTLKAYVKTSRPWLFMPFDTEAAVETGVGEDDVLISYMEDWISNAPSAITYNTENDEILQKTEENTAENDMQNASTEKENEKEETATENNSETDAYNEEGTETNTDGAEAVPPEESEQE